MRDKEFEIELKKVSIKRTKQMYDTSYMPHQCEMCGERFGTEGEQLTGHKLKFELIPTLNTPYLFICNDCYNELPDDEEEQA